MIRPSAVSLVALFSLLASGSIFGQERSYDFELYELGSKLFSMSRTRSASGVKLVAVDFFWDRCKPCKKALPTWRKLHEKYHDRGLRIVLVSIRQEDDVPSARAKLQQYFAQHSVPFPVAFDKYNLVAKQYGVTSDSSNSVSLPQVFLLDKEGSLVLKTEEAAKAGEEIEERLGSSKEE